MKSHQINFISYALLTILVCSCIKQPEKVIPNQPINTSSKKIEKVNIYIENSGSMLGYFTQGDDFMNNIDDIYTKLTTKKINNGETINDTCINYSYINSKTYKYEGNWNSYLNGLKSNRKGQTSTTSISQIINDVINKNNTNDLSIFVSDCIFSPGRGVNAADYIKQETNKFTRNVAKKLDNQKDLSIVIYRCISNFKGNYYDCQDNKKNINHDRPYFIWVIGDKEIINNFIQEVDFESENKFVFSKIPNNIEYNINKINKKGTFEVENKNTIKKPKVDNDVFQFSITGDFSKLAVLQPEIIDNISNYSINNNSYEISEINDNKGKVNHKNLTIRFQGKPVKLGTFDVTFTYKLPKWISDYSININECDNIFNDDNKEKTFGIEEFATSLIKAYNNSETTTIKFNININ